MNHPVFSIAFSLGFSLLALAPAVAQDSIFRCGNEYTNNATEAKARGCKPLTGGNVTVIQGSVRPASANGVRLPTSSALPPPGAPRVDPAEQRNRDAGARSILESELKRTESRQAELLREYNNGEPEKVGSESRNYQKYLDRVAELKASIARNEEDIAGIKREMNRLPVTR